MYSVPLNYTSARVYIGTGVPLPSCAGSGKCLAEGVQGALERHSTSTNLKLIVSRLTVAPGELRAWTLLLMRKLVLPPHSVNTHCSPSSLNLESKPGSNSRSSTGPVLPAKKYSALPDAKNT